MTRRLVVSVLALAACAPGRKLECVGPTSAVICAFELWSACDGPKGCTTDGTLVKCDDSLGRIGAACAVTEGDENYACSVDGTAQIKCQTKGAHVFGVHARCRGPKSGCEIRSDDVRCE